MDMRMKTQKHRTRWTACLLALSAGCTSSTSGGSDAAGTANPDAAVLTDAGRPDAATADAGSFSSSSRPPFSEMRDSSSRPSGSGVSTATSAASSSTSAAASASASGAASAATSGSASSASTASSDAPGSSSASSTSSASSAFTACSWVPHPNNPLIPFVASATPGDGNSSLPNDPWVLREGAGYRMWFSRGDPTVSPIRVAIHEATSADGVTWTERAGGPVYGPDDVMAFDDTRTETPSVVRLGQTLHLYHSGCGTLTGGCNGVYYIGHATSTDNGTTWTRDLTPVVVPNADPNPFAWGTFTTAEPGVIARDGVVYLYYVTARSDVFLDSDGGYVSNDAGPVVRNRFGIMVATSTDGFTFVTHQQGSRTVAAESPPDPLRVYSGYSTPAPMLRSDGAVELYMDLVDTLPSGGFTQVGLARTTATDAFTFPVPQRLDPAVFSTSAAEWISGTVLAPTVVQDGDDRHLWFAGHNELTSWATFIGGIGYARERCGP